MSTVAAKERWIVFTPESVRALMNGTKTQSRRVIQPSPGESFSERYADGETIERLSYGWSWNRLHKSGGWDCVPVGSEQMLAACPYGTPGDVLWVKETYARRADVDPKTNLEKAVQYLRYKADGGELSDEWHDYDRWRSPRFMPKWASRLRLTLTDVGVERVQDITPEDALAEGCCPSHGSGLDDPVLLRRAAEKVGGPYPRGIFAVLWDEINGARGFGWDANPYVWPLTFERLGDA